jgi:serine/threonine protein kinase
MECNNNKESEEYEEKETNTDPIIGKVFFSKYKAIKKLGEGSFGKVYKAEYNKEEFAIKMESKSKEQGLLETEATIMSYLKGPNIPFIKSYGYSGNYNVLVMQLLDKSLEDLFNEYTKFSIKTTAMLGYQMVSILQYIHDRHIIHRDIKPDNFVMGSKEHNDRLYLLDFGLAKKYRSSRTLIQYPYVKKKKLTGTARYASIHALEAYEQSRRDDLESVGYVLMYFLRGNLPWQGLKVRSKEDRYKKILEKKKDTSSEDLCKNFPHEFYKYVDYTKNLDYTENPDYDMLKQLFLDVVIGLDEKMDYVYDWTTKEDLQKRKEIKKKDNNSEKETNDNKDNKENKDNKNKNNKNEEIGSYNEQNDRNYSQNIKRDEVREDKVESVCCIMYVYILYNFLFLYSF